MKGIWQRTWFRTVVSERFKAHYDLIEDLRKRLAKAEFQIEQLKKESDWLTRMQQREPDYEPPGLMGTLNLVDLSSIVRGICEHLNLNAHPPDRTGWIVTKEPKSK